MTTIDNKNKRIKIHKLSLKASIFITEVKEAVMMDMMVMQIILTVKSSSIKKLVRWETVALKTWDQQLYKQDLVETPMDSNGDHNMHKIVVCNKCNSRTSMNTSPVASQIFRLKIGMIASSKNHQVVPMKTENNPELMDLLWDNLLDLPLLSSQFKCQNEVFHLNPSLLVLWISSVTSLKLLNMKIIVFKEIIVKLSSIKKHNKSIRNNTKLASFPKISVSELLQLIELRLNLINSINEILQP